MMAPGVRCFQRLGRGALRSLKRPARCGRQPAQDRVGPGHAPDLHAPKPALETPERRLERDLAMGVTRKIGVAFIAHSLGSTLAVRGVRGTPCRSIWSGMPLPASRSLQALVRPSADRDG